MHADSEASLKDILKDLSESHGAVPCIITSGPELNFIIHNFPELYTLLNVMPNPVDEVRVFSNKYETYRKARTVGINTLSSYSMTEAIEKIDDLPYPCIVKWNSEIHLINKNNFKTSVVKSVTELKNLTSSFNQGDLNHLLVQQFIDSSQHCNISYLGYFDNGIPRLGLLVQQLRQYPQGITSYLKEYKGFLSKDLAKSAEQLIGGGSYTGFAEVEFKLTNDMKTAYLLEVNPRTCGWSSALIGKYPNMINHILHGEPLKVNNNLEWFNILRDLRAVLKSTESLPKKVSQLFSFIKPKTVDVFSITDPLPFISPLLEKCTK
ncbi:ATP-grasp enzyme [Chitinivibrio alkaliphilus]|uniref:ATP-grasp enzyme n=1 Tax=Chitinivibrio alkaliphilus ACht1 TaxID=1313304 RepID=U7D767_9BACT|nr:ATP-grasp enzyme [Chitinivibrio alkaliphilus]ERP31406.1 ATP-grasp enzyme [Chitinivibrio alkaliphilus ACht1]